VFVTANPSLVLPAGMSARPAGFDDMAAILEVVTACDIAVIGRPDYTADDVAADLRWPGLVLERDTLLVVDERGAAPTVVAWADCHDDGSGEPEADLYVHPETQDAVGPWTIAWIERRAVEIVAGGGKTDPHVSVGSWSTDTVRAGWLQRAGWKPVRTFYRMAADLAPDTAAPELPAGVVVKVAGTDEKLRRAVHASVSEAFRDHWEATERTYEAFWDRAQANAGYDPSLIWLIEVDGEPAAAEVGTAQMAADNTGWINYVAVRRDYRGRGLAKLLLRLAFAEFARRGWAHAQLAVDTNSPTGALRLYESVGMRQKHAIDMWRKDLPDAG
jgi:ribosomal protein S18 acetylase RimI-like enzyme